MSNAPEPALAPREVRPRSTVGTAINQLAQALSGALSAGDVSALRRMDPADPACPAFFKVAATYLAPAGLLPEGDHAREEAERRWGAILSGMAIANGLHQPGRRLGHALAAAGMSELRFVRLLRAHDRGLLDAVRAAARFLASKAEAADWAGFAELVLSDGRDDEERVRRRIARDYYAELENH